MKSNGTFTIKVTVKPNAKKEAINYKDGVYEVKVSKPPIEGKANENVIKLIADYFQVPKSYVKIIRGEASRIKFLEIKAIQNAKKQ